MIVKQLQIVLTLLIAFSISGCSWICPKPEPEYVYETIEVKVPVKCIIPEHECNYDNNATLNEKVGQMASCYYNLKLASEVCK
jgi:hypothetical protein